MLVQPLLKDLKVFQSLRDTVNQCPVSNLNLLGNHTILFLQCARNTSFDLVTQQGILSNSRVVQGLNTLAPRIDSHSIKWTGGRVVPAAQRGGTSLGGLPGSNRVGVDHLLVAYFVSVLLVLQIIRGKSRLWVVDTTHLSFLTNLNR